MFDFNASLNNDAPAPPIPLSVDEKRKEKSDLLTGVFCVFLLSFVFTTQKELGERCV